MTLSWPCSPTLRAAAVDARAIGVVGASAKGLGAQFSGRRAAINLVPSNKAGRPTTGGHKQGDIVIDNVGAMFLCTASGTPGTWVQFTVAAA